MFTSALGCPPRIATVLFRAAWRFRVAADVCVDLRDALSFPDRR